jgi:hypothetical protein
LRAVTTGILDLNDRTIRERVAEGCRRLDQSEDEWEVLALIDSLVGEQLRAIDAMEAAP